MPKALSRSGRGRSLLLCNGMSWRQRWSRGEEICGGHHVSHKSLPRVSRVGSKGQTMHTTLRSELSLPPKLDWGKIFMTKATQNHYLQNCPLLLQGVLRLFWFVVWVFCVCLFCIALSPQLIQMLALNLFWEKEKDATILQTTSFSTLLIFTSIMEAPVLFPPPPRPGIAPQARGWTRAAPRPAKNMDKATFPGLPKNSLRPPRPPTACRSPELQ